MKGRNIIAISVKVALLASAASCGVTVAADKGDTIKLDRIEVTGSRIKRTEIEGPAPIQVLTAEDIQDKGFPNIYEAIQSLTAATGTIQGQGITNSFTPNAETVNLRGLGPNRTLVLLNGRRVANYPRAFNSQNNVFNLSTIPTSAVARIEIVTGGKSAVYGSDAMAGVVNIITKKNVEHTTVTALASTTDQGGADNRKFTITGGANTESFSWTYSVDYSKQDMLLGNERDWLDSVDDGPATDTQPLYSRVNSRSVMAWTIAGGSQYVHPNEFINGACDQWTEYDLSLRPDRGYYCGKDTTGDSSYINERENVSIYNNFQWDLSDEHQVFGDLLYWNSDSANQGGLGPSWRSDNSPIDNLAYGRFFLDETAENRPLYLQRTFTPSEIGGDNKGHFEDDMYFVAAGMKGIVLEEIAYEVAFSHSKSKNSESEILVAADKARDYFLGARLDANDPLYSPDWQRFWRPLGQAGRDAILESNDSTADASVTTLTASLSGAIMELSAGDLGFAAVVEYGSEDYRISAHPRTLDESKGWGNGLTATEGSGERDRYGVALEFEVPITEQVKANIAGRYDYYDDNTDVDGAFTYQIGIEYRPTDDLLVRGSYGTSFRAPDIHQVNAGPSGSYSGITDDHLELLCQDYISAGRTNDGALTEQCDPDSAGRLRASQTIFIERTGNTKLKEETGFSATVGFAWEVAEGLDWTFDAYRIRIEDQVESWNLTDFFKNEAACRRGTANVTAERCDEIISRVDRFPGTNPTNGYSVDKIRTTYVNQSFNELTGIETNVIYKYDAGSWGEFTANMRYNHVLEVIRQEFPGDPINKEYRDDFDNDDLRSKVDNTFTWHKNAWRVSLQQIRYGSTWNAEDPNGQVENRAVLGGRLKPWLIYNAGVTYDINDAHSLRFGVNNLRDTRARNDGSWDSGRPWFNREVYPTTIAVMGRSFSLQYTGSF
ncbi:TonB-dependent receptor domain-containing protein [Pseudoalteromonas sp. MMG012]|uniref:TonB-dependent receptor domain-containing protein n=1 Tax=Pseudoalteromonas sp. MMG012 TaxID=2822686 RepID=UPI001B3A3143|nr:TonB-dependent receptor [Pseudoalteromonas sp. MMG012]MBQ4849848.1 TonB-dependent receptor [Pseudoalteromonas sp. MMG012]